MSILIQLEAGSNALEKVIYSVLPKLETALIMYHILTAHLCAACSLRERRSCIRFSHPNHRNIVGYTWTRTSAESTGSNDRYREIVTLRENVRQLHCKLAAPDGSDAPIQGSERSIVQL